jgi:hypothetical protein
VCPEDSLGLILKRLCILFTPSTDSAEVRLKRLILAIVGAPRVPMSIKKCDDCHQLELKGCRCKSNGIAPDTIPSPAVNSKEEANPVGSSTSHHIPSTNVMGDDDGDGGRGRGGDAAAGAASSSATRSELNRYAAAPSASLNSISTNPLGSTLPPRVDPMASQLEDEDESESDPKQVCIICKKQPNSPLTTVNCCGGIFCFTCISQWVVEMTSVCPRCNEEVQYLTHTDEKGCIKHTLVASKKQGEPVQATSPTDPLSHCMYCSDLIEEEEEAKVPCVGAGLSGRGCPMSAHERCMTPTYDIGNGIWCCGDKKCKNSFRQYQARNNDPEYSEEEHAVSNDGSESSEEEEEEHPSTVRDSRDLKRPLRYATSATPLLPLNRMATGQSVEEKEEEEVGEEEDEAEEEEQEQAEAEVEAEANAMPSSSSSTLHSSVIPSASTSRFRSVLPSSSSSSQERSAASSSSSSSLGNVSSLVRVPVESSIMARHRPTPTNVVSTGMTTNDLRIQNVKQVRDFMLELLKRCQELSRQNELIQLKPNQSSSDLNSVAESNVEKRLAIRWHRVKHGDVDALRARYDLGDTLNEFRKKWIDDKEKDSSMMAFNLYVKTKYGISYDAILSHRHFAQIYKTFPALVFLPQAAQERGLTFTWYILERLMRNNELEYFIRDNMKE